MYLTFRKTEFTKLAEDFAKADYLYVILSMIMGYVAFISRGIRWNLLLEPLGKKAKTWNAINAIAVAYLVNTAVPRAGEIARCTTLKSTDDIPFNRLVGTVVLERIIDMFMLLGLMAVTFVLEFNTFKSFFETAFAGSEGPDTVGIAIKISTVVVFLIAVFILYRLRARFQQLPFYSKVREFWYGLKDGLKSLGKVKNKFAFFAHTFFIWFMYYLMIYVVTFALPATQGISPTSGLFIMIVGGLGMVVPSPGGIGSYHYLVMLGMGVLGVASADGVSFATLVHGGQFFMTLIAGFISLAFVYRERRKLKKQNDNSGSPQ